jgi:hypothetical protein
MALSWAALLGTKARRVTSWLVPGTNYSLVHDQTVTRNSFRINMMLCALGCAPAKVRQRFDT